MAEKFWVDSSSGQRKVDSTTNATGLGVPSKSHSLSLCTTMPHGMFVLVGWMTTYGGDSGCRTSKVPLFGCA